MEVQIGVVDGDHDDRTSLTTWLGAERELRGAVRATGMPTSDTELGTLPDVISIALGTSGAGTVLASSLITWLRTRRTTAKVVVRSGDQSVELELRTLDDVRPLLEQVLKLADRE